MTYEQFLKIEHEVNQLFAIVDASDSWDKPESKNAIERLCELCSVDIHAHDQEEDPMGAVYEDLLTAVDIRQRQTDLKP